MTYTLYIDQFFFYQMGMNYIMFSMIEQLFFSSATRKRKLFISGFVSLISLGIIMLPFGRLSLRVHLAGPISSVLLIFWGFEWMKFVKKVWMSLVFMVISLVFGSILNYMKKSGMISSSFLIFLVLVYVLYRGAIYLHRCYGKMEQSQIYQILLTDGDEQILTTGIMDSGNLLQFSRLPWEKECEKGNRVSNFFHGKKNLKDGLFPVVILERTQNTEKLWEKGDCEIPYHSLGNRGGKLTGVLCEQMQINGNGENHTYHDVILGLYDGSISESRYEAILPTFQKLSRYES